MVPMAQIKTFGGDSMESKEPKRLPLYYLFPLGAIAFFFFVFATKTPELIAVPVIALLMSPFWIWMRNRHELNKLKAKAGSTEETAKSSRTEERIANLEALLCRLDAELNQQMERSLISTRLLSTPTSPGI